MGSPQTSLLPACLILQSPSGAQTRVELSPLPFGIGRLGENQLVLRDTKVSRRHARITWDGGYVIEDLNSHYGVFVNGRRVQRQTLSDSDTIDFGFADSYRLVFRLETVPDERLSGSSSSVLASANLRKLRAMVEVARALQASLSTDEVLAAVVDAALTVTGCERGFLLLREGGDLETRIARDRKGPLPADDLKVPKRLLMRALQQRKDFLSLNFDPAAGVDPGQTIAALELRSVVCLPLVRVRTGDMQATATLSTMDDTIGVLYMDSRAGSADLSSGGRELLTTLALEASTVLENARLLEEQWSRQRMQEELRIARSIQEKLLPRRLPESGWFRAAASSLPSLEVGGDYVDVRQIDEACWSAVMADVSGKGVGAALLASLLQGIFLAAPYSRIPMQESVARINRFLNDRTGGEQYATLFYMTLARDGTLHWTNAGHPPPLVLQTDGRLRSLEANGFPLGLLEEAEYEVAETHLAPGDRVVIYSDGLSEARNAAGEFFGTRRLKELLMAHAGEDCRTLHETILCEVEHFTGSAPQQDDISLAVLEVQGLEMPARMPAQQA